MVLVADLVLVAAEAAAAPDAGRAQPRQRLLQGAVARQARCRVPVLQPPVSTTPRAIISSGCTDDNNEIMRKQQIVKNREKISDAILAKHVCEDQRQAYDAAPG